jgi:hypothetical protein
MMKINLFIVFAAEFIFFAFLSWLLYGFGGNFISLYEMIFIPLIIMNILYNALFMKSKKISERLREAMKRTLYEFFLASVIYLGYLFVLKYILNWYI